MVKIEEQARTQLSVSVHMDPGPVGSSGLQFRCTRSQRKSFFCIKACLKFTEDLRAIKWWYRVTKIELELCFAQVQPLLGYNRGELPLPSYTQVLSSFTFTEYIEASLFFLLLGIELFFYCCFSCCSKITFISVGSTLLFLCLCTILPLHYYLIEVLHTSLSTS